MLCRLFYTACTKHLACIVYGTLFFVFTGLYFVPVAALLILAADGLLYSVSWIISHFLKSIHAGWKAAKPKLPDPPKPAPPRPPTEAEMLAALRADFEEQKAMLTVLTRNDEERQVVESQLERAFLIRAQKFLGGRQ